MLTTAHATPTDIVVALRGSSSVVLRGFAQLTQAPSFLRPWVHFVSPSISAEELQRVFAAGRVRKKVLNGAALVCTHLLIGVSAVLAFVAWQPTPQQEAVWRVVAVDEKAVRIRIGDDVKGRSDGRSPVQAQALSRVMTVPVGAKLPDGQVLTMVDPERSMYAAGTTRVFLTMDADKNNNKGDTIFDNQGDGGGAAKGRQ